MNCFCFHNEFGQRPGSSFRMHHCSHFCLCSLRLAACSVANVPIESQHSSLDRACRRAWRYRDRDACTVLACARRRCRVQSGEPLGDGCKPAWLQTPSGVSAIIFKLDSRAAAEHGRRRGGRETRAQTAPRGHGHAARDGCVTPLRLRTACVA